VAGYGALGFAVLEVHGDGAVLSSWKDRLARAAKFLNGFITIETGNVNYPATSSLAFVLCGRVLGDKRVIERGRGRAHGVLAQVTENGFLVGEGHPLNDGKIAGTLRLIVPVIAQADEKNHRTDAGNVRITKAKGTLAIGTDAAEDLSAQGNK
jgi:hypothetical protein